MPRSTSTRRPTDRAHLAWAPVDPHRRLARLGLGGLLAGGIFAVTGPPPLDLHGPLHYLGIMDPLCGMTRGVLWTLRGRLERAAVGWLTGRWLTVTLSHARRPWSWLLPQRSRSSRWRPCGPTSSTMRPCSWPTERLRQ